METSRTNSEVSTIYGRVGALLPLLLPALAPYSTEGPDVEGRLWYVYGKRRAYFEPSAAGFTIYVFSTEVKDGSPLATMVALSGIGPLVMLLAVALIG